MPVRLRRHLLPLLVLLGTFIAIPAGPAGALGPPASASPLAADLTRAVDRALQQARAATPPLTTRLLMAVDGAARQARVAGTRAADIARRRSKAARAAEALRLRRSKAPEAVVRLAWLLGANDRGTYTGQRAILHRARRLARQLPGARGRNQRDALAVVDRLAASHILTVDRLRPVLLTLSRNSDWWVRRAAPAYGRALVRGHGPVSMKYIPGQGLVLHQLSSWALVDALAGGCLADRAHCPRRRLRAAVDRMMALAVRRDGVVRAESYFRRSCCSRGLR